MKPYTLWKIDEEEWLLEIEDEKLGDYIKDCMDKETLNIARFGVGINVELRVFKVPEAEVDTIHDILDKYCKRRKF